MLVKVQIWRRHETDLSKRETEDALRCLAHVLRLCFLHPASDVTAGLWGNDMGWSSAELNVCSRRDAGSKTWW